MKQRHTGIETTPLGVTNAKGIINANWSQFELLVNPVGADHTNSGINYDVAAAARHRVFGDGFETLSGNAVLDFDTATVKVFENITTAKTFTFANMGFGKFLTIILNTFEKQIGITWPSAASLTWLGTPPTTIGTEQFPLNSITSDGANLVGTISSGLHNYAIGDTVLIRSSDVSAYNGQHVITSFTLTTFTAATALSTTTATTATVYRYPQNQTVIRLYCMGNSGGTIALGVVDYEDD